MSKTTQKTLEVGLNLDGDKVQLTESGKRELEAKLKHLVEVDRAEVRKELAEARAQGDLSENADYDAAKNKQAEVEAEIARIQDILTRVQIIHETAASFVKVGSVVTYVKDGSSEQKKIQIVGPVQVDPSKEIPMIGSDSPFAKALLGKRAGETVRIEVAKSYNVTIKKIS